jgi:hypothetical protein
MLYINLFSEGGALLELGPQGDASVPVFLPAADSELIVGLLTTAEASAVLAKLYLAGVPSGNRIMKPMPPIPILTIGVFPLRLGEYLTQRGARGTLTRMVRVLSNGGMSFISRRRVLLV